MATITGTTATDTLFGTAADDIFLPYGVGLNGAADFMSGGDGADLYDLTRSSTTISHKYIIDDNGLNGAGDSIIGPGSLVQTASFGYIAFATALRDGDDLIIVTPYKPHRFRKPAIPSYEITIVDHFAGEAVETMVAGGVTYQLATGPMGSGFGDIMAGTNLGDVVSARGGDDYMTGNDGDDRLTAGKGKGKGNDMLFGTDGDDMVFGNSGANFIWLGAGADTLIYKEADPQLLDGRGGGAANDFVMDFDVTEDQMDFTEMKGLSMASLTIANNAVGNAVVSWDSGTFEIADIFIELRGVTAAQITVDHFIF